MPYLIDGYNLLHAMGVIRGRLGPQGLEKARLRLLGLLQGAFGPQAGLLTVVFDAAGAPAGAVEFEDYHGVHVRYAIHQQQADDLIELLIQHEGAPHQLVVISDDHRIQQAARRRRAPVLNCFDFLEEVDRQRRLRRTSAPPEDEKKASPREMEFWLHEFADLESDPELKEFFEMDRFGEGDFDFHGEGI